MGRLKKKKTACEKKTDLVDTLRRKKSYTLMNSYIYHFSYAPELYKKRGEGKCQVKEN